MYINLPGQGASEGSWAAAVSGGHEQKFCAVPEVFPNGLSAALQLCR